MSELKSPSLHSGAEDGSRKMWQHKPSVWRLWLLRMVGVTVCAVLAVLALRIYYALTPVALTAQALAWDKQADELPVDTENGLRVLGMLAPEGLDAVDYGRCLLAQDRRWISDVTSSHSASPAATEQERIERCAPKPHTKLSFNAKLIPSISLSTSDADWTALATAPMHPVLWSRYQAAVQGGPRFLGADFLDPHFSNVGVLRALHRVDAAQAAALWIRGDRTQATARWHALHELLTRKGAENLTQSMGAVHAHTQALLALQYALQQDSAPVSSEQAATLVRAIQAVDAMPQAQSHAFVGEWRIIRSAISQPPHSWEDHLYRLIWNTHDSLNPLAKAYARAQHLAFSAANGVEAAHSGEPNQASLCQGSLQWLCLPFVRNPFGMWVNEPDFFDIRQGTHIADLRNLAAATRLTIEARRQGLRGDALARFVASAPEGMRDLFTQQAFAYNIQTRELTIALREKSPVLGEPGAYRLPL